MAEKGYKIHSVKYNLIMNVILKMSAFLFPLITFPYVSRVLGPEGNGKVAFATSVLYYFSVVATLGIPTCGVKICAQFRDNKEKLSKTVKELLFISSITMVLSYIIFFIALMTVPKLYEDKLLMLINSATILLTVFGVEWFYQAIEQYDYITFRNLAFKILSMILMFLFVKESKDYVLYGAITVIGTSGSNVLNIIRLNKIVDLKSKQKLELSKHIRPILMLFLLTASTTIYTSLDSVMLGFISGDEQVGFYNAATKLKNILVSLVTALGTVLLPRISYYLSNNMKKEFISIIRKSFNFVFLSALPLVIYCIVEAKDCIDFLAGTGYQEAVLPMQLISMSVLFIGISNIIGIQILIPLGLEKYTLLSTGIGAVVNLILNSILIPKYAASGAALATSIAELSVLVVQLIIIKNKFLEMINIKNIFKIFIAIIIATSVLLLEMNFLVQLSTFMRLLVSGLSFIFIYGFFVLIFKEEIIIDVLLNIQKKIFNI